MKFKRNEKYASIAFYAFITIFAVAILILGIINFSSLTAYTKKFFEVISPITYAFVIAYLCSPLVNFLERTIFSFKKAKKNRKILKRVLSITLSYVIIFGCLTAFGIILVPQITSSYNDLTGQIGQYISGAQSWADNFVKNFPLFGGEYESFLHFLDVNEISADIKTVISNSYVYIEALTNYVINYAGRFVIELKNLIVAIFLAIYFLFYKEKLAAQLKKLTAAVFSRRVYLNIVNLARYSHEAFGGFIIGKIIDSLIIGIITLILTWILKIPYFPIISLVIGVTNVIPIFGPVIGAIPTSFIVLIAEPQKLIWFILLVIGIQQLDGNVIGPKILGDKVGIGAMWVMVSIIIAGGFFGITGMILGVPTFAVIYTLLKQFSEYRLKKKSTPSDTEFYRTDPPGINFKKDKIIINKNDEIPDHLKINATSDNCDSSETKSEVTSESQE